MTEDEMVGWHHRLSGHEFEQALGDSEGQCLTFCSPWHRKESDTTEQLNNNKDARNAENVREEPGSSQTRGGPGSGPWEGGSCQRTSVRRSLCLSGVCGSYCCPITNTTIFVGLAQPGPEMMGIPLQT